MPTRTTRSTQPATEESLPEVLGPELKSLPSLAGVATQDLVETIGTGKYAASYINWARTLNLLHEHAPGWLVESVRAEDGSMVHRAPVGGYLLIRFRNLITGDFTPEVPQAIMDNRNSAIPYDKITARDITDTHRRGACLAAAMTFGLAHELWAKMPLETGYQSEDGPASSSPTVAAQATAKAVPAASGTQSTVKTPTKDDFLQAALDKGLTTYAAEALEAKLNGNYAGGISRLSEKDENWVTEFNNANAPKQQSSAEDGSQY
jgi:hypothetical protein